MFFFSPDTVTNISFRNTFCNVAVNYELVAFWRYFIRCFFYYFIRCFFYYFIRCFFIISSDAFFDYFIRCILLFYQMYFIISSDVFYYLWMLKYGWNVSDKKTIWERFVWHIWAMFSFTKNIHISLQINRWETVSFHLFFLICMLPKMWARSNAEVFDGKLYVMLYYYAAEEVSHKKRNSQKINWKVGEDIKGGRRIYTNILHFVREGVQKKMSLLVVFYY